MLPLEVSECRQQRTAFGPTLRWVKVKQKGWTDAEDGWRRRISAGA